MFLVMLINKKQSNFEIFHSKKTRADSVTKHAIDNKLTLVINDLYLYTHVGVMA